MSDKRIIFRESFPIHFWVTDRKGPLRNESEFMGYRAGTIEIFYEGTETFYFEMAKLMTPGQKI